MALLIYHLNSFKEKDNVIKKSDEKKYWFRIPAWSPARQLLKWDREKDTRCGWRGGEVDDKKKESQSSSTLKSHIIYLHSFFLIRSCFFAPWYQAAIYATLGPAGISLSLFPLYRDAEPRSPYSSAEATSSGGLCTNLSLGEAKRKRARYSRRETRTSVYLLAAIYTYIRRSEIRIFMS